MPHRRVSRVQRINHRLDGRSVVFLGMMGCGKSAIGKMVAKNLGLEFRDADMEIEMAAGRTVAEIFADYGEDEFRRVETRVIRRILEEGPVLLALGGGAFMAEETRKVIAERALSVWLNPSLNVIVERVGRRPKKRPLLRNGNPREIIQNLMEVRNPVYAKAQVHVGSDGGTKSEMRDMVLNMIDEHLETER